MSEILHALDQHARDKGGETALTDDECVLTWKELETRVAAQAEELWPRSRILGVYGDNGADFVVALLGAWLAGKTVVPLPTLFSASQLHHVVQDSGIGDVVTTRSVRGLPTSLRVRVHPISRQCKRNFDRSSADAGLIIYTSGSTGTPKGVRLGLDQVAWQAATLAQVTHVTPRDVHLSVLPLSLLLETVCAVAVPVLSGARTHFATEAARTLSAGRIPSLARLYRTHAPTTTALVPQLLSAWVAQLQTSSETAPESLRFVALGGAPVADVLAERAWHLGIPVHEGYGLSECCSVVSVNVPGQRKAGTVGRPLPGLDIRIDRGEIIVNGPTVMRGYLNGASQERPWRTGDLGVLDADGYLTVTGRKDNLLVTAFGRNVSPEWIEALLLADPKLAACALLGHGERHLRVLLIPSPPAETWFAKTARPQVQQWIERMCAAAPDYAVPKEFAICTLERAQRGGLLTANGRIRRAAVPKIYGKPGRGLSPVTVQCL